MKKASKLAHYRLTEAQKRDFKRACELKGAKPAAKTRELIVEFTNQTFAEYNILTGNK